MPCEESHDGMTPPVSLQRRFLRVMEHELVFTANFFFFFLRRWTFRAQSEVLVVHVSATPQLLSTSLSRPRPRVITWLSKLTVSLSIRLLIFHHVDFSAEPNARIRQPGEVSLPSLVCEGGKTKCPSTEVDISWFAVRVAREIPCVIIIKFSAPGQNTQDRWKRVQPQQANKKQWPHSFSPLLCMSWKTSTIFVRVEKEERRQHLYLAVNAVTARPLLWEFRPLEQTACFQRRPSFAIISPLLFILVCKLQLGSFERVQGGADWSGESTDNFIYFLKNTPNAPCSQRAVLQSDAGRLC